MQDLVQLMGLAQEWGFPKVAQESTKLRKHLCNRGLTQAPCASFGVNFFLCKAPNMENSYASVYVSCLILNEKDFATKRT